LLSAFLLNVPRRAGGYRYGLSQKRSGKFTRFLVRTLADTIASAVTHYQPSASSQLCLVDAGLPYNSQRGRYIGGYFGFAFGFTCMTCLRSFVNLYFALGKYTARLGFAFASY
jgi:hypothetical protein